MLAGDWLAIMDHQKLRLAIGVPQHESNFVGAHVISILNDLDQSLEFTDIQIFGSLRSSAYHPFYGAGRVG